MWGKDQKTFKDPDNIDEKFKNFVAVASKPAMFSEKYFDK